MVSWSSPLNYALSMLCEAGHWSFKCYCLVQRLVIRQKYWVQWILWKYPCVLYVWNCPSRIISLVKKKKYQFQRCTSLFWNFHFFSLFTDIPRISWTIANCRPSLFCCETASCFLVSLLIGELFIFEIKSQGLWLAHCELPIAPWMWKREATVCETS